MSTLASEEKSFMQTTFSFISARVSNHIYFSRLEIVYDARARKVTEQRWEVEEIWARTTLQQINNWCVLNPM